MRSSECRIGAIRISPACAELAADDDELGVEEVAQARGGDADVPAGVRDDPSRAAVAGVDAWSRSLSRCIPSLGGNSDSSAGPAGVGLEAAAVAAPADRSVLVDRDVPDLAGLAVDAAEQVAADDEAGADGVADADEDRGGCRAGAAFARLGETAEVRLAVDEDGPADAGGEALGDVDALPAAQQAGGGDHAGARVDGRRQRESDGEQVADRAAERLHHVARAGC